MNFRKILKERYVNYDIILILFLILLIVSTIHKIRLENYIYSRIALLPLCAFAIIFKKYLKNWILWLLISISLTLNLCFNYFYTANHMFLATYFSWILTLILLSREDLYKNLRICSKWLLIIILGMAALHKLTSVDFVNGSFISFEILSGVRKLPVLSIHWPQLDTLIQSNKVTLIDLFENPSLTSNANLLVFPDISFFIYAKILSWVIIGYEFLLFVLFIIYPKFLRITHLLLMLFIFSTYMYTNENMFFSMLCLLGFLLTERHHKKIRLLYICFIVVLLTMQAIGFRPGIL